MKCDREHCRRFKHSHIIFFLCDKANILSRLTCNFKSEIECIYVQETTLKSKHDKLLCEVTGNSATLIDSKTLIYQIIEASVRDIFHNVFGSKEVLV